MQTSQRFIDNCGCVYKHVYNEKGRVGRTLVEVCDEHMAAVVADRLEESGKVIG